jgi:uncharacterized protein with PIN domain
MFADDSTLIDFEKERNIFLTKQVVLAKRMKEGRLAIDKDDKKEEKYYNARKLLMERKELNLGRAAPLSGSHGRTTLRGEFLEGTAKDGQ